MKQTQQHNGLENEIHVCYSRIQQHIKQNMYTDYNKTVITSMPTYRENEREFERIIGGTQNPLQNGISSYYNDMILYAGLIKDLNKTVQDGTYNWLIKSHQSDDPAKHLRQMSASVFPQNVQYLKELIANFYVNVRKADQERKRTPTLYDQLKPKFENLAEHLI